MKKISWIVVFGLMMYGVNAQENQQDQKGMEGQEKATFKLEGEEGQCGPFEDALAEGKGITSVDYNWINEELEVEYNPKEISIDELKTNLEEKGYVPAEGEAGGKKDQKRQEGGQSGQNGEMGQTGQTQDQEIAVRCKHEKQQKGGIK